MSKNCITQPRVHPRAESRACSALPPSLPAYVAYVQWECRATHQRHTAMQCNKERGKSTTAHSSRLPHPAARRREGKQDRICSVSSMTRDPRWALPWALCSLPREGVRGGARRHSFKIRPICTVYSHEKFSHSSVEDIV